MAQRRSKPDTPRWPTPVEARLLAHLPVVVVGIAGTSGKTITGDLLRRMLVAGGRRVTVGLDEAIDRADRLLPRDIVLLSLPPRGTPHGTELAMHVLAVTGMAPDELSDGATVPEATDALRMAMRLAREAVVLNADDPRVMALAGDTVAAVRTASLRRVADVCLSDGHVVVAHASARHRLGAVPRNPFANAAFGTDLVIAAGAASLLGAPIQAMRDAVADYTPPPHHFQLLGLDEGVRWVDDGAATRPGRTAATLSGGAGPVVLLAGGAGVSQPLSRWARAVRDRCPHALLFGPASSQLARALQQDGGTERIVRCADLDDAVSIAPRFAERGDTILFSPSCAPESARSSDRFRERAPLRLRRMVAA